MLRHRAGTDAENIVLAGRAFAEDISWCVPRYTPKISQQKLILERFVSRAATDKFYFKRT